MFNLMDEMSELVYVVDIDTYDLLFINSAGRKTFGIDQTIGLKCYEALQGKDSPCDFCTTHMLSKEKYYTWEISNTHVNRHYILKDRLIDWDGKVARLEIAFDTTDQEMQKLDLQNTAEINAAMLECLKTLYEIDDSPAALNKILEIIGVLLEAEGAYIFDIKDEEIHIDYQWHSERVAPQFYHRKWLGSIQGAGWHKVFGQNRSVIIDDVESMAETDPEDYAFLKQQNAERLAAVQLELDGKLSGVMVILNPSAEKLANISLKLDTLGYFTSFYIQRNKDKKLLEKLSYYDTLTGLLNRNAFNRDLQVISQKPMEPMGVIYININGMKEMNDRYGHAYGDSVLCDIAKTLDMKTPGATFYRIGGDEFVALCEWGSELQFEDAVMGLKNTFDENASSRAAIGHRWADNRGSIDDLVLEASELMYADKKTYYYGQATSKRYRHKNDDILGLTRPGTLQNMLKEGRFIVHIQPKFSVDDRRIIGAEALVRLLSPEGTLIPPDDFIPILEAARLIEKVDFFVFEYICSKIKKWLEQGKMVVPISVNFSRYTLTEKLFAERLSQTWECFQIPQKLIEIEITESMNVDEGAVFLEVAEDIRNLGFAIAIDDFGVKHANVSLFTQIKFDVLKIDKILISKLQEDKISQIILQSISDICHKLDIHLIVEGVETEQQFEVIESLRCEGVQGYLFERPMPMEDFEEKYIFDINSSQQEK